MGWKLSQTRSYNENAKIRIEIALKTKVKLLKVEIKQEGKNKTLGIENFRAR